MTSVRLSAATFLPLLSPPLRVSLQSLRHPIRRPPLVRTSPPSQCRSLHLYKTARAKTVLGMHKVIPYERYEPPALDLSEHKINLVDENRKVIAADITLEQLYNDHVKSGEMVYLVDELKKWHAMLDYEQLAKNEIPQKHNNFAIVKAHSTDAHVKVRERTSPVPHGSPKEVLHLETLREVHLLLHNPPAYVKLMLDKAYRLIELGCPIEFSIRIRHQRENKIQKTHRVNEGLWDYVYRHFPHLRPDFLLKSMPPGTRYMIKPFSDGRTVQFVVALPSQNDPMRGIDLTQRLLKVKGSVRKSIDEGKQGELPKAVRFARIESGDTNYSLDSGRGRNSVVPSELSNKGKEVRWGEGSFNELSPTRRQNWSINWRPEPRQKEFNVPEGQDGRNLQHRYMVLQKGKESASDQARRSGTAAFAKRQGVARKMRGK